MTDFERARAEWEAVRDTAIQMGGARAISVVVLENIRNLEESVGDLILLAHHKAPSKNAEEEWLSEIREWSGLVLQGAKDFCENFRKEHMPDEGSDGK